MVCTVAFHAKSVGVNEPARITLSLPDWHRVMALASESTDVALRAAVEQAAASSRIAVETSPLGRRLLAGIAEPAMRISSRREPKGYGLLGVTWARSFGVTVTLGLGRRRWMLHWRDSEMEKLLDAATEHANREILSKVAH